MVDPVQSLFQRTYDALKSPATEQQMNFLVGTFFRSFRIAESKGGHFIIGILNAETAQRICGSRLIVGRNFELIQRQPGDGNTIPKLMEFKGYRGPHSIQVILPKDLTRKGFMSSKDDTVYEINDPFCVALAEIVGTLRRFIAEEMVSTVPASTSSGTDFDPWELMA